MTYTLDLSQLNQYLIVALPLIVAFIAGVLRQDGFNDGLNDTIFHVVLIGLAVTQTLLGGKVGGSSLANFIMAIGLSYGALSLKYKYAPSTLMNKVQTATSIWKAPPVPSQAQQIASELLPQLLAALQARPVDQQPTQQMQVVRTNTPPIGG